MVTFRPTVAQALARGAYLGGLVGALGAAVVLLAAAGGLGAHLGLPIPLAAALPLALGAACGGVLGVILGRQGGATIDDLGIHPVLAASDACTPWRRIGDLRVERRGGRTLVAVCMDTGQVGRLAAPYQGRLLAADPDFEHKLFMLRNLWETHRSFGLSNRQRPSEHRWTAPPPARGRVTEWRGQHQ